jgi:hypothetical protein
MKLSKQSRAVLVAAGISMLMPATMTGQMRCKPRNWRGPIRFKLT